MSLFDADIIEDSWVGMAYKLWYCTNGGIKNSMWCDAFEINFSTTKLRDTLKHMLYHNGQLRISASELEEMNDTLSKHHIYEMTDEYKFIILICLVVPSISEKNLSDIFTSCLKQVNIKRGDTVEVKATFHGDFAVISILVHTFTPQKIDIVLKKK